MIGFESGELVAFDCAYAKVKSTIKVSESAISGITTFNNIEDKVLVLTQTKMAVVLLHPTLKIYNESDLATGSAGKRSLKKQQSKLTHIRLSNTNDHILKVSKGISVSHIDVNSLETRQVWSNANIFNSATTDAIFLNQSTVAVCSASECSVWCLTSDQPLYILDMPSKERTLQKLSMVKTSKNGIVLGCLSQSQIVLYKLDLSVKGNSVLSPLHSIDFGVKPNDALLSMSLKVQISSAKGKKSKGKSNE